MKTYQKITRDIYQIRLPLPFALNHVNCYLLKDGDSWTILDTGLNISEAREAWQTTFSELRIHPAAINRIILTHTHPDHYGLAGWLQEMVATESGHRPSVWVSPPEAEFAIALWQQTDDKFNPILEDYYKRCNFTFETASGIIAMVDQLRERTAPHPQTMEHISPGETIQIGLYNFKLIHAPGHSDGQLILYDPDEKLALCGDHVLSGISPHIGLWPGGSDDPLGHYLTSLKELTHLDVKLALPGHKTLITDWAGRLSQLQTHHADRLERTFEFVENSTTVSQVSRKLFDYDRFTPHEIRFAIAETLAHLEYLVHRGQLYREDRDGVWWYIRC
jgi:glyoxylase-like metal-dependent hydrolase (beta-lactamase superfamily II)